MVSSAELRAALEDARLLAIARGGEPARVAEVMRILADEGVRLAEVSLSEPRGLDALAAAAEAAGDRLLLGAGTVLGAEQAEQAAAAGARFAVTPGVIGAVADACARLGMGLVPGAFTPTEVAAAAPGAAAVKLFPASLGGPAHLEALRGPFPNVPFVAVGGVGPDEAPAFLAAGAIAIGVGSPLFGDALEGGDLDALRTRARALLEAVA